MTAQISDKVIYNNDNYVLIGKNASGLFTPYRFGIMPKMLSTACYRGYHCAYELKDDAMYLQELHIYDPTDQYPTINGVAAEPIVDKVFSFCEDINNPEWKEVTRRERRYSDLKMPIQCTGKMRIAKDFIQDLYIHMGFQKASAFEHVLDITLFKGKIANVRDRSAEMKTKRGQFKSAYESGDFRKTVDDAFSLDMDLE